MDTGKIKKIASVFTPSAPISNPRLFIGRDLQREHFKRAILSPGRHVILYGERGVGKTSLLNIVTKELDKTEKIHYVFHRCSHGNTFNDIVATFLRDTGQLLENRPTKIKKTQSIYATLKAVFANGGAKSTTEKEDSVETVVPISLTPHLFVTRFCKQPHVFVLDEFDVIADETTKKLVAETIKALSDENSVTKIVICGVASSAQNLMGHHPSVVRNFSTLNVPRMTDDEIKDIINNGFKALGLGIDDPLTKLILTSSHGLPYFPHLICEELAAHALRDGITRLNGSSFFSVLNSSFVNIAEDIRFSFDQACSAMLPMSTEYMSSFFSSTPSETRKHMLMSLALSANDDPTVAASLFNFLIAKKGVSVSDAYKNLSEVEVIEIMSEIATLSDVVAVIENRVRFRDAIHRGYVWLRAAHEFGEDLLLEAMANAE